MRIWINWHLCALLMRMCNDTASMENSVVAPQKLKKNRIIIKSAI